jgi:uncharacterized protein YebE (UPF0316 family)
MFAVLTTAVLAMASVSLWTLRVALTARNHAAAAVAVASVEATVFVAAFSRMMTRLDSVGQIVAYALGVAAGTLIGIAVERRIDRTPRRGHRPCLRPDPTIVRQDWAMPARIAR